MEFYKTKLKNGPTILFEKRDLPIAAILIATKAGAAHETVNKKGIAHFTEHMPFKGTKTRNTKQISSTIEKVGGIVNAFTADEITAFWCKIPSRHFSTGAEILFDLVTNPKFAVKDINKERNVILSEISRYHDIPQIYLFDKQKELLYKGILGMPVIGFKETVAKINRQDFLKWHRLYCPENLIVSVVGSVDLEEIKSLMKKYFEKPYKKTQLPKITITRKSGSLIEKRAGLDQTHFTLALHMPSLNARGRYASELFNAILGEGMSSRLFEVVREKRGLAYAISSYLEQEKDYGYSVIYAGIEKKNVKKVKELVLKEIKKMAQLKASDLDQAKEQKIGNWQLDLEACDTVVRNLVFQEIATKAEDFYDYPEKISDVLLKDVRALAKIKNYSLAVLVPK